MKADDLTQFCPGCGYDLRGLNSDRCPECGDPFDRSHLPFAKKPRNARPLTNLQKVSIVTGSIWAILLWPQWLGGHRGPATALPLAILMLPSYLLVAAARKRAMPMRVFVACATLILIVQGLHIVPGRIDLVSYYVILPPVLALLAAILPKLMKE